MIKVSASNLSNGTSGMAFFQTDVEADAWIADQIAQETYGKINQYQFIKVDYSNEAHSEAMIEAVSDDMSNGLDLIKKISAYLRDRVAHGFITIQELSDFVETSEVTRVERHLRMGNLTLARNIIEVTNFSLIDETAKNTLLEGF
jgi:hypothetical protein